VLSAEQDWLQPENDGLDAFRALLPFPGRGPNAARLEAVLTAFARTVVTARDGRVVVIVEDTDTGHWVVAHEPKLRSAARVIAFAA
jgi:phenylpyruvate tautomerase PptA (4-oxalocrotonate tautomerase family)